MMHALPISAVTLVSEHLIGTAAQSTAIVLTFSGHLDPTSTRT